MIVLDETKAQQVLDALEMLTDGYDDNAVGAEIEAIVALRQALKQPKQELTGKKYLQVEQLLIDMLDTLPYNSPDYWIGRIKEVMPLYTSPPKRKPLTDEQIKDIEEKIWNPKFLDDSERQTNREFVRAIETAHGIKENT